MARGARRPQAAGVAVHAALAAVTYLPLLLTGHGRVASDTRQAVYLDPGRFLADALSMWDPSRDLGTVTHQNIVLVWPMGVWFWVADRVGCPIWLAQRLWLGSILFAAGAGVCFLARTLGWGSAPGRRATVADVVGPAVAALTYALSPYVIQYGTRTSVLLLPWAALPWLIGLTQRALTTRGWRHPALLALVVASMAVNATALALALLGPLCWTAWVVWGTGEVPGRDALRTAGRVLALGVPTSAWWLVALLVEGRYGMPLLDYTETIDQVASTSAATEVLRGLGYWVPYLREGGFPEVTGAAFYLDHWPVLALGSAVVALAIATPPLVRWRHAPLFSILVVVGVVVGVGAYPPADPGPMGSVFHDLARSGGAGLVLRSTTRAAPLALLGLAVLLGALVGAAVRHAPRAGAALAAVVVAAVALLAPSIGTGGDLVDPLYSRPEHVPGYWDQALHAADALAGGGRMLELPGTRYAAYRWGNTYEPITAGRAGTPSAWREQVPYGGPGSADLLVSLDNRIQENRLDPRALAPLARLMGASVLVVRNDLDTGRYGTVAPEVVHRLVERADGLGTAQGFGSGPATGAGSLPAVEVVPVDGAPGLVSQAPLASTVLLDGSGEGIVDAAGAGLIDGRSPVLYAQSAATTAGLLDRMERARVPIVLTDSNRRAVERWRSVRDSRGITLRADQDPTDESGRAGGEAPLDVLAPRPDWQTVATPANAAVSATRYGHPLVFEGAVRPAAALDGDPDTAWQVGPYVGGTGDALEVALDAPLRTDRLTLRVAGGSSRLVSVELRLDDEAPVTVRLDDSASTGAGQVVRFASRPLRRVRVELGPTRTPDGVAPSPVGIAEIGLRGPDGVAVRTDEIVRLPIGLVRRLGPSSLDQSLSVVLTRRAGDPTEPGRFEEEPTLVRRFELPTGRSFTLTGRAGAGEPGPACRTDLVTLDAAPVPVTLTPGPDGDDLAVSACAVLPLGTGSHLLRTADGADVGVDIDQVVLASAPGGGPVVVGADGRPGPVAAGGAGLDSSRGRTSVHATTAVAGPSWVVLGQSRNDGWDVDLDGAGRVGATVLVNGYANGVLVDAPAGTGIGFDWTPQRAVTASLWLAVIGVAACALAVLRGRSWRLVAPGGASPAARGAAGGGSVPGTGNRVCAGDAWRDRQPHLGLAARTAPASPTRAAAAALLTGLATAAAVGPWWGLVAAVAAGAAAGLRGGRHLLSAGGAAAVVAALGWVLVERGAARDEAAYGFFTGLHGPHRLALSGLVLLGAGAVLDRRAGAAAVDPRATLRAWRARRRRRAPARLPAHRPTTDPVTTADGRRFALGCVGGAVPALVAFTWLAATGSGGLFARRSLGGFYDAQAHALLDGHLDVPRAALGIEAFTVGGRSYMYQGPFPALLRLPVAALTDRFDSRLTGASMVLAFAVALIAVSALAWQVRRLVRPGVAVTRAEAVGAGLFVFAATAGSAPLFLASQLSVYHESALWGVATTLAALAGVLHHLRRPGPLVLAAASALAVAALWSRASVGLGAVAALGAVALRDVLARRSGRGSPRAVVVGVLAAALPLVAYAALNQVKFDSPVSVPWRAQELSRVSTARQEFLDANDDTFFGARFVPATARAYLRPDAVSLQRRFPWVGFRTDDIGDRTGPGDVLLDKVDATASIPVTFHAVGLLAVLGAWAVVRAARRRQPLGLAGAPLFGGLVAAATIFVFGFVAQRYLTDVVPLMVVAGAAGLATLAGWGTRVGDAGSGRRRAWRGAAAAGLCVVVALGAWTSYGQSLWYQRIYASPGDEAGAASFFDARTRLATLPFGREDHVGRGARLPARGHAGDVFVVGDCAGLYVSDGGELDQLVLSNWKPVQRSPRVGVHDLDVIFDPVAPGTVESLLGASAGDRAQDVVVERLADGRARFGVLGAGLDVRGAPVDLRPGRRYHLEVSADPGTGIAEVRLDGAVTVTGVYAVAAVPTLGHPSGAGAAVAPSARWRERPVDTSTCRRLTGAGSG